MHPSDQTRHFANDLEALIGRYRQEYEITYAQLIGVLQLQAHMLCRETVEQSEENDDDGE